MSYGVNAASGLVPYSYLGASNWNKQESALPVGWVSGFGSSVYKGDPLIQSNDGTVTIFTTADQTTPIVGIFQGCSYQDPNTQKLVFQPYWIAGTTTFQAQDVTVYALVDRNIVYNVQTLLGGATRPAIGGNLKVNIAAGSPSTGLSGTTVDFTGTADRTIATLPVKVIGLTPANGNSFGLQYNNVLVVINNHFLTAGTTGV